LTSTKFTKKLSTWNTGDELQTRVAIYGVKTMKNEYYIVTMDDYKRQIVELIQLLRNVSPSYYDKHNSKCLSG
jgi:hypothetical protein